MKKKVLSVLLCGMMAMGMLAGCGSTSTTASSAPAESKAAAETTVAFYKDDTEFYEAYKGSFDGTYQRLDITKRERE